MISKESAKMNNIPKEKESEKVINARSVRNAKTARAFKIATIPFAFLIIVPFKLATI